MDLQKRQACLGSGHAEKVGWRRIRTGVETALTVEATTAEAGVEETSGLWRDLAEEVIDRRTSEHAWNDEILR